MPNMTNGPNFGFTFEIERSTVFILFVFVLKIHDMLVGGQDILGMYFIDLPVANCRQVRN